MYTEYNYLYTNITESLIIVCVTNDIITHIRIKIFLYLYEYIKIFVCIQFLYINV